MESPPIPPQLFFCKKCKVYFYSDSKMTHPTHTPCRQHNTELTDRYTLKIVETINKIVRVPKK